MIRILIAFTFIFLFSSFNSSPPKEISLTELKTLYKNYYLTSEVDSINWINKSSCDPGTIPLDIYKKAENRINFFRLMNRLPLIKITNSKQEEAQAAAFMMDKNKTLSHNPSPSWKCYSIQGAEGAKNSCLGLPNFRRLPHTAFITGFIADPGDANYFVGHRRWLLYSKATEFSLGATKNALALYCTNNLSEDTLTNDFIAYPWSGFVPYNLIFSKWSFSIPETNEADFSKIKLTVHNKKGIALPVLLMKEDKAAPDRTITWKVIGMFTSEEEKYSMNKLKEKGFIGEELTVKIENIKVNKKPRTYEYKVKITEL